METGCGGNHRAAVAQPPRSSFVAYMCEQKASEFVPHHHHHMTSEDRFRDLPVALVTLRPATRRDGGSAHWVVLDCPFCHRSHEHGADRNRKPEDSLGPRVAHCGGSNEGLSTYVLRERRP